MVTLISRLYIPLALVLLIAAPVHAGELSDRFFKRGEPVSIEADKLTHDRDTDTYYAEGGVVAVQGELTLKADRLTLDMASGAVTASGGVVLKDSSGDSVNAETLEINMNEDTAVIMKGRLFFKEGNVYISAEVIRKTGPRTYESEETTFTTCDTCGDDETPAWSFHADTSKVTVGGFFVGRGVYLYLKGLPVLYSPFISASLKRERKTGFLMPRPGYSELRGFKLDNSFFWAIAGNRDATFYLDIETDRGAGTGVEYRYVRKSESYGRLFLYYYGEKDMDRVRTFRSDVDNLSRPLSADDDRWQADFTLRELMGSGVDFKADIRVVSDDEYFIDFAESTGERTLESLESTVSFTKRWDRLSFVAQARVFDNLLVADDSAVLQKLPEFVFTGSARPVFGSPVWFSFGSSFVNYLRGDGDEGQRLDLAPTLSLPMNPRGLFEFTPSITPRWTYYLFDDTTGGSGDASRYIYEARADLTTTLYRFFDLTWQGVERVAHTIRPRVTYSYIPSVNQDDLPSFDVVDRIDPANVITYSLNMTVGGRLGKSGPRHEFLYMDLAQSYDIREARADNDRPFSDVTGELILRPRHWAAISVKGSYDIYDDTFENYDASVVLRDERGNGLDIAYRFLRDSTEFLEASAGLRIKDPYRLSYKTRYSFDEGKAIETSYGFEYTHQCWSARLSFSEKIEESIVLLTFNLKGLGDVFSAKAEFD